MPACFQLTRKGDSKPSALAWIDSFICQRLDLRWNKRTYTHGWFDDIGFKIALGRTLPELIDHYRQSCEGIADEYRTHELAMWRIAAFLNEEFTTDAWHER